MVSRSPKVSYTHQATLIDTLLHFALHLAQLPPSFLISCHSMLWRSLWALSHQSNVMIQLSLCALRSLARTVHLAIMLAQCIDEVRWILTCEVMLMYTAVISLNFLSVFLFAYSFASLFTNCSDTYN